MLMYVNTWFKTGVIVLYLVSNILEARWITNQKIYLSVLTKSKMRRVELQWAGDFCAGMCNTKSVLETIDESTSEHDGVVKVVVISAHHTNFSGRRPFLYRNEIYLAVYKENYVVILEDNALNVKELIFLYDNEIIDSHDLSLDINLSKYL